MERPFCELTDCQCTIGHLSLLTHFQTREITAMDVWLLICMTFVTLAAFEYAMLLTIFFDKGQSMNIELDDTDKKAQTCYKVDRISLKVFIIAYALTVCAYFVVVYQIK